VHEFVQGSPEVRRRFVDWGTFHVEPSFLEAWQRYQRAVRQRNAALKGGGGGHALEQWTATAAELGEALSAARERYMRALAPEVAFRGSRLVGVPVRCRYTRGWPADTTLAGALARDLERDRATGATRAGPHRGDLVIEASSVAARDAVSRGQEKLIGAALVLSQVALHSGRGGKSSVLLLDDPAAELDRNFLGRLLDEVSRLPVQLVITGLDASGLPTAGSHARFHVERGRIRPLDR